MTDERQIDETGAMHRATEALTGISGTPLNSVQRERSVGDILAGMLERHQTAEPGESAQVEPHSAMSSTADPAFDVNRIDGEQGPTSTSTAASTDATAAANELRSVVAIQDSDADTVTERDQEAPSPLLSERSASITTPLPPAAATSGTPALSPIPPSDSALVPALRGATEVAVLRTAHQVSTKRGFPVYRTNPSVPMSGGMSTRTKRFHVPGGKASVIVDHSSGEIKGLGGMGFWWEEEVDSTRFVKLFLDGIKQAAGLSKTGMQLFEMVYLQMRATPGSDEIKLNQYAARDHGISDRTYQRGVRELLEKELLYRSPSDGVFFVNIRFMFNGDRLAFVRSYHMKEPTRQHELALTGR